MAFVLTSSIVVNIRSNKTEEFKEGSHEELPTVAISCARTMKVLKSGCKGKEVSNSEWFKRSTKEEKAEK